MLSREETFALAIGKLEHERLTQSQEQYDVQAYLMDAFHLDIEGNNLANKVYDVIQQVWSKGVLELYIRNQILTDKLQVKDLVAFDTSRFVTLIEALMELEILDEQEAWGLLFLNAARVQDVFVSTEAFKVSYLKGSLFYEILLKSEETCKAEKIQKFDILLETLQRTSGVAFDWLEEDIFERFCIEESVQTTPVHQYTQSPKTTLEEMHRLLMQEDKCALWRFIEAFSEEERNKLLPNLYMDYRGNTPYPITAEEYLELPALYPDVSYAHYLRAMYFYHFAWETRGLGMANTVGQQNYAQFYRRLKYALEDLKKAYELSPYEETYWAELYNVVKHFNSDEATALEKKFYGLIQEHAMQNMFCVRRVAYMKQARWGGSHKEGLMWAREVIAHNPENSAVKIMIFEALIEDYHYILEFDKDEERANAIFKDQALQDEVNHYFDTLLAHDATEDNTLSATLLFWYEKVGDGVRLQRIRESIKG